MTQEADRRIIDLLQQMESREASDLFLSEDKVPALRIHGVVHELEEAASTREEIQGLVDRLVIGSSRAAFEMRGDWDAGLTIGGRRFRLNLSRQQGKLNVVARAVPSGAMVLDTLGLPEVVGKMVDGHRGLILVTGATGSGKSTTLAAMVHHINVQRASHIITVEDPIEYVHEDRKSRITQREIGGDTESFQTALKHVVRQSPDVILIGEMRDAETMRVALSAALTGHMVMASLHTIDATQTLQRMLSYFPAHQRDQVALDLSICLTGIISQRLVPRLDGKGRVLATEILTCTSAVGRLLREQRVEEVEDLMRTLHSNEMCSFNESLLKMYKDGAIDFPTGQAYSTNPDEFSLLAKGMATGSASFRGGAEGMDTGMDMKALLGMVLKRNASDLHLTVGRPPILRITGSLMPVGELPLSESDMRMLLYSIMSGRQRTIYELEREVDFALALENGQRFRVNAYFQKGRMAAALRAIPSEVPDAEALGLPDEVLRLGDKPQGLLLVVGPTGAGKSTTMACLIDRINRSRRCRIITIEDPVEYSHQSHQATVDQREVYEDTKSFSAALKFILRQDPDVILVGEMRDLETIGAVLTAAETGHLVLATMHSNDCVQAVDRIIDVYPSHQQSQARAQLSSSLLGVVSQRLLPRADGNGRVASFEIMVATSAIRNLIRENKMHQALGTMEASRRDGMNTMDFALKRLVEQGLIDRESALQYALSPSSIPEVPNLPKKSEALSTSGGSQTVGGVVRNGTRKTGASSPAVESREGGKKKFPWNR
jgi:twitching motility protein PilT